MAATVDYAKTRLVFDGYIWLFPHSEIVTQINSAHQKASLTDWTI